MRKTTIMVVDSDGVLSREVEAMLSLRVKNIHYIKDPSEAIRDFASVMPQIVITDLKIAMMDTVDFVSKIKNMNYSCELIVALGFVEPHKLIEMVDMGIYRFVQKPLTAPKLMDAIGKAMDSLVEKAVTFQSKYMQEILNAEDNPVFATDGVTILKANKAFLDCFGAKSLNQFLLNFPDIISIFGPDDGATGSLDWLKDFITKSEEPKVQIYDNRLGQKRVFLLDLGVSEATRGYYVVTMTDITDIEGFFNRKIELLSSQINSKERIKFRSMLEFEVARCKRYNKTFSLVLIGFEIDEKGAIEGWDKIFKIVRKSLRESDLFSKIDKNRLAIIATETPTAETSLILDRLKTEFENLKQEGFDLKFRCNLVEFGSDDTAQSLLKRAMDGL